MVQKITRLLFAAAVVVALVACFPCATSVRHAHAQEGGSLHDLAVCWNRAAPGANTNILTTSVRPLYKLSVLRITVVLGTSSVVNVVETDGTATFTSALNSGGALTAGQYYTFVIGARNDASSNGTTSATAIRFNFQVATNSTIPILRVEEINSAID